MAALFCASACCCVHLYVHVYVFSSLFFPCRCTYLFSICYSWFTDFHSVCTFLFFCLPLYAFFICIFFLSCSFYSHANPTCIMPEAPLTHPFLAILKASGYLHTVEIYSHLDTSKNFQIILLQQSHMSSDITYFCGFDFGGCIVSSSNNLEFIIHIQFSRYLCVRMDIFVFFIKKNLKKFVCVNASSIQFAKGV